jgi:hypothetical protein
VAIRQRHIDTPANPISGRDQDRNVQSVVGVSHSPWPSASVPARSPRRQA